MLNGHGDSPVSDMWRSEAVRDALDLCLACKGCKTDCPANVDMATYKAEFLAHHFKGRPWRRPRSDLALGWLPVAARVVSRLRLAGPVNGVGISPALLDRLGGGDRPTSPPAAAKSFSPASMARPGHPDSLARQQVCPADWAEVGTPSARHAAGAQEVT